MTVRISLMTVFTGNTPKLKRTIKNFLNELDVGFVLQTTEFCTSQERMTMLIMEGEKDSLYEIRNELVLYLNSQYPAEISNREWEELVSEEPLLAKMIKMTPNSTDPDSSGNDSPTSNEKAAKAVKYDQWISGLMAGAYKTLEIVNKAAKVAKSVSDSFKGLDVKNIFVSYKNNCIYVNIGKCRFWKDFITILHESAALSIPKEDFLNVFIIDPNGERALVNSDIEGLEAGKKYFVETQSSIGSTPKFSTKEDFFKALKDEEGMIDEQILKAKTVIAEQGITCKQLMETGDLAITDAELKEYGIAQGGLRKAILSLIKSNRK